MTERPVSVHVTKSLSTRILTPIRHGVMGLLFNF